MEHVGVARLCGTLITDAQQKPAEGGKKCSGHYANTTLVAKDKNGATYTSHMSIDINSRFHEKEETDAPVLFRKVSNLFLRTAH